MDATPLTLAQQTQRLETQHGNVLTGVPLGTPPPKNPVVAPKG